MSIRLFPTCQVRVVRFSVRCVPPRPSSASSLIPPPRRISSASFSSQWASPDLICQLFIAASLAGPPLRALDRSGPRWTSTGESLSALWASPDLNPARFGSLWASPDITTPRDSDRCGPRRTSTGEIRRTVGLAGPQPARFCAPWALPDLNRTSTARSKAI